MVYNPKLHKRHSIRLQGYDYASAGAYFVTVCLNQRFPKILQNNCKHYVKNADTRFRGANTMAKGADTLICPYGKCKQNVIYDFPIFGIIENENMILNDCGKMIEKWILKIKNGEKFSNIYLDEYIIMPDHIHVIIKIDDRIVGADPRICPSESCVCPICNNIRPESCVCNNCETNHVKLGTIIQWFKIMTTNEYINGVKTYNWIPFNKRLWQRNYFEHIIRNEIEYSKIAEYIYKNPVLWGKTKNIVNRNIRYRKAIN